MRANFSQNVTRCIWFFHNVCSDAQYTCFLVSKPKVRQKRLGPTSVPLHTDLDPAIHSVFQRIHIKACLWIRIRIPRSDGVKSFTVKFIIFFFFTSEKGSGSRTYLLHGSGSMKMKRIWWILIRNTGCQDFSVQLGKQSVKSPHFLTTCKE